MNKSRKKIYKAIICLLVFTSLNITNFAAIVSDNDGSTFVTKAEFEALKKSFSEQIDDYNSSIDGKIDGAIASYLAGIQLATTEVRGTLISGAEHWLMYGKNDYPKYVDGYPYITGFTSQGHFSNGISSNYHNVWLGINFNGNPELIDDTSTGKFKKHMVNKPSQNVSKNGNNLYVAEWEGYFEKEGEIINLAYFSGNEASTIWAYDGQDRLRWQTQVTFSQNSCPVQIGSIRWSNESGNGWTGADIYCSSAQRKNGIIKGDTFVSVYDNIVDNRFWDSTTVNKVGLSTTNPTIPFKLKNTDYINWIKTAVESMDVSWSCNKKTPEGADHWKDYENTSQGWTVDMVNFGKSVNSSEHSVSSTTTEYYLPRISNDDHDLNFNRLWSARTDNFASNLETLMNGSSTSVADKNKIKAALLWDASNTAHLSMGAGFPFVRVEDGEKVQFDFKIAEAGDFYVYAKYGPFKPGADPETEADVVFSSGTDTGYEKRFNAKGSNFFNTLNFDVKKSDYIFLKWCSNDKTKGGTLDLSSLPIVTLKKD